MNGNYFPNGLKNLPAKENLMEGEKLFRWQYNRMD
jgi:hypothetical protein